jgi:hypothetical protein
MGLRMQKQADELDRRLSRLEARLSADEKAIYLILSTLIAMIIRTTDPPYTIYTVSFTIIELSLIGIALYNLIRPGAQRRREASGTGGDGRGST